MRLMISNESPNWSNNDYYSLEIILKKIKNILINVFDWIF